MTTRRPCHMCAEAAWLLTGGVHPAHLPDRLGVSLSLLEKHARSCLPPPLQRLIQQERTYRDAPR